MHIDSTTSHQTLQWRDYKPFQGFGALKGQLYARPEMLRLICINFYQINQIDKKTLNQVVAKKAKGRETTKSVGVTFVLFS